MFSSLILSLNGIFTNSYFDTRQSKGGSTNYFAVRHGGHEIGATRVVEEATWKPTDSPGASSRCLCFRFYLAGNAGNFRRGDSKLFAQHVELYRFCEKPSLLLGFPAARRRVFLSDEADQSGSENRFRP